MNKKEFPIRGHCLSTKLTIVKYLQDNFKGYANNVYSKKAIGVAWNDDRWWYVINKSSTPQYNPSDIINIITKINEMNNSLIVTGTLATSGTIIASNYISTTRIDEVGTGTIIAKSLVTEPIKLRIICRNLKKSLKVSLLQINLK